MARTGFAGLLILFFIMPLFSLQGESGNHLAVKGQLRMNPGDLEKGKILPLDGEWSFFWNRLLPPDKLPSGSEYLSVPVSWNFRTGHPAHGYATLSLLITGLKPSVQYSLYVPDVLSNIRLWINDTEMWTCGKVGRTAEDSIPQFLPGVISFSTADGQARIVVQISNFNYRKSGILRSFQIGSQAAVLKFRESRLVQEVIIAAILLTLSLFHIGIYAYRNQEKVEFIFGLVCLTFVIRILCTGEETLTYFFPSISWEIVRKLEFIPFYGSAPLLIYFVKALFPDEIIKWLHKILIAAGLAIGIVIWILPVSLGNNIVPFMESYAILGLGYSLFVMIRAFLDRRDGASALVWAYLIFSLTVVNDVLYASQQIHSFYASPLGFVIFMVIQSQLLISRYSRAFHQRDQLSISRDHFRRASITDSLTGLFNVRYLHSSLGNEIHIALSEGKPLSLIMADVDNFKLFNDTWGHKQGDEVLSKMGEIIRGSAREHDSPCRYGGEEFSVILPDTTIERALEVAERIRSRFEEAGEKDERLHGITVSLGVSQYRAPESGDSLIDRADKALYLAKNLGKNRVEKAE